MRANLPQPFPPPPPKPTPPAGPPVVPDFSMYLGDDAGDDEDDDDGWDEDAETAAMGAHVEAVKAISARVAAELNATPGPPVKGFDFERALRAVSLVLRAAGQRASELKSGQLEGPVRRMLERMRHGPPKVNPPAARGSAVP